MFEEFLDEFHLAYSSLDQEFSRSQFWQLLSDKLYQKEVHSIGYPFQGVQVLRVTEARYIPFRMVVILGVVEGDFPRALPKDYVLDDWLKTRAGLAGWQYIEALEDITFNVISSSVNCCVLCYPQTRNSRPTVRSRFIERLLTANKSVIVEHSSAFEITGSNNSTNNFETVEVAENLQKGKTALGVVDYFAKFSATGLKNFIRCPYRYLLSQLGVESSSFFIDRELSSQGQRLHKVIELFWQGGLYADKVIPVLKNNIEHDQLKSYLCDRLIKISQLVMASKESPAFCYHLERYSWPKFAEHIANSYFCC